MHSHRTTAGRWLSCSKYREFAPVGHRQLDLSYPIQGSAATSHMRTLQNARSRDRPRRLAPWHAATATQHMRHSIAGRAPSAAESPGMRSTVCANGRCPLRTDGGLRNLWKNQLAFALMIVLVLEISPAVFPASGGVQTQAEPLRTTPEHGAMLLVNEHQLCLASYEYSLSVVDPWVDSRLGSADTDWSIHPASPPPLALPSPRDETNVCESNLLCINGATDPVWEMSLPDVCGATLHARMWNESKAAYSQKHHLDTGPACGAANNARANSLCTGAASPRLTRSCTPPVACAAAGCQDRCWLSQIIITILCPGISQWVGPSSSGGSSCTPASTFESATSGSSSSCVVCCACKRHFGTPMGHTMHARGGPLKCRDASSVPLADFKEAEVAKEVATFAEKTRQVPIVLLTCTSR